MVFLLLACAPADIEPITVRLDGAACGLSSPYSFSGKATYIYRYLDLDYDWEPAEPWEGSVEQRTWGTEIGPLIREAEGERDGEMAINIACAWGPDIGNIHRGTYAPQDTHWIDGQGITQTIPIVLEVH